MKVAAVLGLAAIGALAAAARRVRAAVLTERPSSRGSRLSPEIGALIESEAIAQGLAPEIAMVFAELESSFNPKAYGDRDWALRYPHAWQATQQRLSVNPAIGDPSVWGSYGLFGLLAAYHVEPHEHPHVLWNPTVNAQRGVTAVKHAMDRAQGDIRAARLLYIGCGRDGRLCSAKYLAQTDKRLRAAARRWHVSFAHELGPGAPDERQHAAKPRRRTRSVNA